MQGKKAVALSIGGSAVLFMTLASLAIYILTEGMERTFTASVAWLTHAFADEVSAHMTAHAATGSTTELESWAKEAVQEYLLYAQVVKQGAIIAEDKAPQAINLELEVIPPQTELSVLRGHLPDGTPYLDLVKMLHLPEDDGSEAGSYLRIGISLDRVRSGIWKGASVIAMVSLICFLIAAGLILYLGRTPAVEAPQWAAVAARAATHRDAGREDGGEALWEVGQLRIDDRRKEVRVNGRSVKLTPREYAVLKTLASEPGRVFSDREIITRVWPENSRASADDVRKYIRFLRRKLEEDPTEPELILTVKGFGYKLSA